MYDERTFSRNEQHSAHFSGIINKRYGLCFKRQNEGSPIHEDFSVISRKNDSFYRILEH
eukprot:UN07268